jgi:hypothetical protein
MTTRLLSKVFCCFFSKKQFFLNFFLLAALAGCGTLPQPFLGRPGVEGARLAVPPPPMLIVPPPRNAMLGNRAAALYARDMARALVARDVPSLARPASKYEWHLAMAARLAGGRVEPDFTIIGPNGKIYGRAAGVPAAAADWAEGAPSVLHANAEAAAPALIRQLRMINAAVQRSNPDSLENRPARVRFTGVSGAPGDGDHALALNIRHDLPGLGIVLVNRRQDADFVLSGLVKASPRPGGQDVVELDWLLRDTGGRFIGKVSQLHDLRRADMVPYWGDVAAAAAGQAAGGIKQVIANATLKKTPGRHPAARPAAAPSR